MSDTFDLISQPWLRVRWEDERVEEVSLREVFREAPRIRGLAGELPTQDAAILRLLLAILLSAVRPERPRSEQESIDLWADWWEAGELPAGDVEAYLERHRDRFDLLHPATPFLQVAGLTTASGNRSGLRKLIADVPAGHQFFTTRAGEGLAALSLAEAARWLVHCQAFDPSGIKTGAVGDDRVKGGRGYPLGYPAWAGNLGLVVLEGGSLFETLLLNLPLDHKSGAADLPVWERAPLTPAVDSAHPAPHGPADVFTWPSRRLRLFVEDGRVTDVQISNGDRLEPHNLFTVEPMSAWRRSANQSKSRGETVYMPTTHDPTRRLWQGLGGLLVTAEGDQGTKRPAQLGWIADLIDEGVLAPDHPVTFRAIGITYGTQSSVIDGAIDDRLAAHVVALTDPILVQTAVDAAARAGTGVAALANLASNLAEAAGNDREPPRSSAFELGYSSLDPHFRQWLRDLDDPQTANAQLDTWGTIAKGVLVRLGDQLAADAGIAAILGRDVPKRGTNDTQRLDAARAQVWFRAAINKAFSIPSPQPQEDR